MRVPPFFGYGHLKTAFLASRAAPYLYAPVPHAESSRTLGRLWSLEHRAGLAAAPPLGQDPWERDGDAATPWTGLTGDEPFRFVERCETGVRFSFVRNPYRRLFAAHRAHITTDTAIGRAFRQAAGRAVTDVLDFDGFVAALEALPEHRRPPVFAAQSDWLLTDSVPFHLFGAVERYEGDWAALAARAFAADGAPAAVAPQPGRPAPWSCGPAARDAILRLYGRDFAAFGYDGDPAALDAPPALAAERHQGRSLYFTPFWLLVDSRVQLSLGKRDTAIRQIEEVIEGGEAGLETGFLPALRLDLARLHLEAGDLHRAEAALRLPRAVAALGEGMPWDWCALLADIALRRNDPDEALSMLRRGLGQPGGVPDGAGLRELGLLSVLAGDLDAALQAGRAIVAAIPPGEARIRRIDALVEGLDRPESQRLVQAVLDDLEGVEGLGYDVAGALARRRRRVAVPVPAAPAAVAPVVAREALRVLADETAAAMEALRRRLLRAVLENYPFLFDAEHYARSRTDIAGSGLSPLDHYIEHGSRQPGCEPNRFFNGNVYANWMARRPLGHLDPLVHYAVEGAPAGIDPSPYFESARYLQQWPALQGSDENPLNHHLAQGGHRSGGYGTLPERVLSELTALTVYDPALLPDAWRIGAADGRHAAGLAAARRKGAVYGRLDRDLAGGFSHLVLIPWVAQPGGADRVAVHVLRMLAETLGADAVVAIATDRPSRGGYAMPDGLRLLSLRDYDDTLRPEELAEVLERLIIERRPQVTFVQNSSVAWGLLARRAAVLRHETALYATLFGYGFSEAAGVSGFHPQLAACLDSLTAVITDNSRFPAALRRIMPMLARQAEKIHVVHTPGDPDVALHPPAPEGRPRQALWMGRFSKEKRMDVLGRIAAATPERRYLVYGSQNPFVPAFDTGFLHDLPNLSVRGAFRDLGDIPFNECDAFVYTSDFDGLPLVLLEATAMGLPIVAPDVGGIGDLITAETGWLVSGPDAVDEYAAALRAIESDPALVRRKVRAAQALLRTRHGWDAFRARYASIPGFLPGAQPGTPAAPDSAFIAISLGSACQVAYQIRRYLKGKTTVPGDWINTGAEALPRDFIPFPFDWLGTTSNGIARMLESKLEKIVSREHLEFMENDRGMTYVLDRHYETMFFHFFDISENFMDSYDKVMKKLERSSQNFLNAVGSGRKIAFVRQSDYPDENFENLHDIIRDSWPDLDFVLLAVSSCAEERDVGNVLYRCIPMKHDDWRGHDDLWDRALDECRALCSAQSSPRNLAASRPIVAGPNVTPGHG